MRIIAAMVAVFGMAAAAHAADEPRWIGNEIEKGASLIYGIPQSGYGASSFSCERKGEALRFSFAHAPIEARTGVKVAVLLSSNNIEISVPTVGQRLEMDDLFVLEGRIRLDQKLRQLLTSSGILEVWVEDGSAEFPLSGAREAARPLLERCG